jgi:uncharacterized phage-associated protein
MKARIATETIFYILRKMGNADKIQLVKLIYLADKYHLLLYGRTITGDRYFAVRLGPMGSMVEDVLNFNKDVLNENDLECARKLILQTDANTYSPSNYDGELTMLSKSDKKAIDFIIEQFGRIDKWQLKDFTHKFPEWKRYESLFEKQLTTREDISTEDLLTTIPEYNFNLAPGRVEEARALLTGQLE